jgi:hypothetical protein
MKDTQLKELEAAEASKMIEVQKLRSQHQKLMHQHGVKKLSEPSIFQISQDRHLSKKRKEKFNILNSHHKNTRIEEASEEYEGSMYDSRKASAI